MARTITVGSVGVNVVPDARGVVQSIRAQVDPEAAALGQRIGSNLSERIANGIRDGIGNGLSGGSVVPRARRTGEQAGGAMASAIRSRLDAALRALPQPRITADTGPAEREIADLRAQMRTLSTARIGVDLDAGEALRRVDEIRERLANLDRDSANVQVRVDAAAALAELNRLRAEVDRLDGRDVDVDVDVHEDRLNLGRSRILGIVAAILAIAPAAATVGVVAVGALAAIGVAAAALTPALAVVGLSLFGIVGATQAVQKAQASAAADAAQKAAAQVAAARQVEQAQRGVVQASQAAAQATAAVADAVARSNRDAAASSRAVADAQQGLVDAQQAASVAVAGALRSQSDAFRSLDEAQQRARDGVLAAVAGYMQAGRSVETAERNVAAAQRASLATQRALTQAREDAREKLEDLASQVANGALDERQAVLDVQAAQDELARVKADPTADAAQRAQAQLTYDQQVQRLDDLRVRNQRLADDSAAATAKGIEGSDEVVAAKRAQVDATQAQVDAEQGLRDALDQQTAAQAAIDKARADGAQAVADAQRSLSDATAAVTTAQEDGQRRVALAARAVGDALDAQRLSAEQDARAIADARQGVLDTQQGLLDAQRDLADAHTAQATAATQASTSAKAAQDALAKLTPEGRSFVGFILGSLVPAFRTLSGAAAAGFLPPLQAALDRLLTNVPSLSGFLRDLGADVGAAIGSLLDRFDDPAWQTFFGYLAQIAGPAVRGLADVFGNLGDAFASISTAFGPVAEQIGRGVVDLTQRFADFTAGLTSSPAFQQFLDYLTTNGPLVADTLGHLGQAILAIVEALLPLGPIVLRAIDAFARLIVAIPTPVLTLLLVQLTQAVLAFVLLANVVAPLLPLLGGVGGALGSLGGVLSAVGGFFASVFGAILPVLEGIGAAIAAIAAVIGLPVEAVIAIVVALIAAIVLTIKYWDQIKAAGGAAWDWIADRAKALWQFIGDNIGTWRDRALAPLRSVYNYGETLRARIVDRIAAVGTWLQANAGRIVAFLRNPFAALADVFLPGWRGKVTGVFDSVGRYFRDHAASIAAFLRSPFDGLVTLVRSIPATIALAWSNLGDLLTAPVRGAINGLIAGWNAIGFSIPGFSMGPVSFPGFSIGTPDIPLLATGGIVTGPTLAVVGEAGPEAVVPLDRLATFGVGGVPGGVGGTGGSAGGDWNGDVRVFIGDTELTGLVRAEVQRADEHSARQLTYGRANT